MPQPGIFGMLQGLGGQPDAAEQLHQAMLAQMQQQQPGAQPAPAATGGAGAGAAPAAPPTPQAYTSQPDMIGLMMKYDQQQRAASMFNQGIAGIAAAYARPWNRDAIREQGANPNAVGMPAADLFNNVMRLQQYQMQNQRLAGFQQAIPGLVKSMGLDPSYVPIMQNNPELAQGIISGHQPTGTYANWKLAQQDSVAKACPTGDPACVAKAEADFQSTNPLAGALLPEGGGPAQAALNGLHLRAIDWQRRNAGEPLPDYFNNGPEALAAHDAHVTALSASQGKAGETFGSLNSNLVDMHQKVADILKAPNLSSVLALSPPQLAAARRFGYVATALPSTAGGISQPDLDLLKKIDEVQRQTSNTADLRTANPHLTAVLSPIETAADQLTNFNVGPDLYVKNIKKGLLNSIDEARAEGIAATGDLSPALEEADKGDANMLTRLPENSIAGGTQFLPDPKRVPPPELAKAKAAIAKGAPKDLVIKGLRAQGWLPKPGEL